MSSFSFYEFFSGGGMARAGLRANWDCLFSNDNDKDKNAAYLENWGTHNLCPKSVSKVDVSELPGRADLAWASFPCQDLSLAGNRLGLNGDRSGTFWPFWNLMVQLGKAGRSPKSIVLENVEGALTSHKGSDFASISSSLSELGYRFGALVIDAKFFVPQSRKRLFIIAFSNDLVVPDTFITKEPSSIWHTKSVVNSFKALPERAIGSWIWWNLNEPAPRKLNLIDLIEDEPVGVSWNSDEHTKYLIGLMSERNLEKLKQAQKVGKRVVGTLYRRTRNKRQRAEVRFDGIAGCLRTPAGGSSRQSLIVVNGKEIRTRLLSPREAARLMGLDDSFKLPANYNKAYHLLGDGLAVPVVRYIAQTLLEPIIKSNSMNREVA